MSDKATLKNLLFIDIETVSALPEYDKLDDRLKVCWLTKSERLYPEMSTQDAYKTRAGIYAEFGKIIVISLGFFNPKSADVQFKIKTISGHNEREVLEQFITIISKFSSKELILCGHNCKEFDFPYLSRRIVINGLILPIVLNTSGKKPWEVKHIDTMELWKFGDKKSYTSLDLITAVLNIPSSKIDMDGSMVQEAYYSQHKLEEITEYCAKDVLATAQVYLRLNYFPVLEEHQVVIVN